MIEDRKRKAVLLLGPTGAGKTPLGDLFEERGLPLPGYRERSCLHFDFGANLRRLVERDVPEGGITRDDLDFLRRVLEDGVLLEDEHFPLARRIFEAFLARRRTEATGNDADESLIILNGLPRHVGQAEAVDAIVEVVAVIFLRCDESSVAARIVDNVGGDRLGRTDDDLAAVRRKLHIYNERTAPLVSHYNAIGTVIVTLDVDPQTSPKDVWERLASVEGE
ncbi:MAG: nucleoside monophosphate kinase [Pirellulales bacterium]|nr:nucleoside monophosphate kinase [Pirellulales bacterium]